MLAHACVRMAPLLTCVCAVPLLSTDYCDTMLQEVLHEYVTRFSAFKRVKHCASCLSMSELRDRLQPLHARGAPPAAPGAVQQLQRELLAVRAERDALRMQLRAISSIKAPPSIFDEPDCY